MRIKTTIAVASVIFATASATSRAYDKVSEPVYETSVREEVFVTVDDGVRIAVDLYRPSNDGQSAVDGQFPVILSFTPYGKDLKRAQALPGGYHYFPRHGYIRALADVRGTGASEGNLDDNYFSAREARDNAQVIDWLGTQPWSNGRVGLRDKSYSGISQYLAAAQQPEHLKAIVPGSAYADMYRDAVYHGGMLSQFFGGQYLVEQQNGRGQVSAPLDSANFDAAIGAKFGHLTSESIAWDYLENSLDGPFYRERSPIEHASKIEVPAFIIGGWFDMWSRGTVEMYKALAQRDGVETRLWMDPVPHTGAKDQDNPFGYSSNQFRDYEPLEMEFYDRYLKGKSMPDRPAVTSYVTGRDEHIEGAHWPPAGVHYDRWFLRPGGLASGAAPETSESYFTNPAAGWTNTMSRHGNGGVSPYAPLDQSLENGEGLVWETDNLASPLTLAGPLALRLVASTTAPDTDWVVRVSDVAPGGKAVLLTEGFLRASHRELDESRSRPEQPYHPHTRMLDVPRGEPVAYEIEVWPMSHEFKPGHRVRVQLTSHDTPNHTPGTVRVDRAAGRVTVIPNQPADNTVYYGGADGSSSLLVPVLGNTPKVDPAPAPRLCIAATPRRTRTGRRTAFRIRVAVRRGKKHVPVRGAKIHFAGTSARTNRRGRGRIVKRFRRAGLKQIRATKAGHRPGRRAIRVAR